MKNIKRYATSLLFTVMALHAEVKNDPYETKSLIAIEGGYSFESKSDTNRNFGVKVGAQSNNYRIFLGARKIENAPQEAIYAYGVDLEHLFNFSKYVNLYMGISGGAANIEEESSNKYKKYYGGDVGLNFHLDKLVDFETGARTLKIESMENISLGYVSIIIKYNMN